MTKMTIISDIMAIINQYMCNDITMPYRAEVGFKNILHYVLTDLEPSQVILKLLLNLILVYRKVFSNANQNHVFRCSRGNHF